MKRFFSVLLVLAMLLTVCVPVCAANGDATLLYSYESDFENKKSNVFSGGWRSFEYSEDCAKNGTVSIKAVGGDESRTGGILWINSSVLFETGKTYSIRFYAMAQDSAAQVEASLYVDSTGTYVECENSQRAITIGSWSEFVGVFKWGDSRPSATATLRIDVGGESDIYIDDLEIYEGTLEYDKTQWQDAEYTEIVPGNAPTNPLIPDNMTLADYSMDFENGSSVQISGKNVTATETGNERYKSQLIADPVDADNTVMKVWLASDVSGEGQYSGKNQNNYAFTNIKFSQSTASNTVATGTIPAGATFKMSFRYYLPQEVETSNNPSFSFYYNTGTVRRLVPSSAPSTVHEQWHTVEMSWTNSTGSDQTITQGSFRLCGNNDSGNGWKASWAAKGYSSTDNGVTFNFGDRAIYLDDFRITIEDAEGAIVETVSEVATASAATSGNLYVDKDARAGGNGSKSAPFNTIEAARDYIRTISDSMTGDIVVNVKGGRYEVEDTIEFTSADSGKNGHFVIYQPYGYDTENEESVVLSGGKKVTEWAQSEIAGVYCAPLSIDYIRNLYVNGTRAQRARYNSYVTPISFWDDTENQVSTWDGFVIPGGIIKNPEKATNLEIYRTATFRSNWAVKGKAFTSGENTVISMEQPYFTMQEYSNYTILSWKETDNFRLENALEFLDEPGEWYHDADTDTLYYMPRVGESIEDCEVIAPDTEQLLTIIGDNVSERAENIIVRGFTFSDGAYKKTSRLGRANLQGATCNSVFVDDSNNVYGAFQYETEGNITVINAKDVSFTDNVIKNMGGVGLSLPQGIDNCEVKGNAIYDISSSAVVVGANIHYAVTDWRIIPRNVLITNNLIGNTGVEYGTDCGIQGYFTNGLEISHNEIYNTTYSSISVGWTWTSAEDTKRNNKIDYNRIYNFGTNCQDGGGIYTLGRQPYSSVRGNYLKCYAQYIVGLYHDSGSSGFVTSGNVVELPADTGEQSIYKNNIGDGDLLISENYFTNYERRFVNTAAATMFDNDKSQGAVRSEEALAIRNASGLTDEYKSLRSAVDGYSENEAIERIYLQTEEQKHLSPANIKNGESLTLKTLAESKNGEMSIATDGLTYSVSDESVLSISGNKITALSSGIATVSVTDATGRSAHMQVTVDDEVVSFDVYADKSSTEIGEQVNVNYRLKTKFTEYVGFPKMSEITANKDVAVPLSDGRIKTTGKGVAEISVAVTIGGYSLNGSTNVTVGADTYRTFKMLNYISKLTQDDIQSYLGDSAESKVTEKAFVEALAAVTESDISKISNTYTENNLTKEKMVAYAADALVSIYGVGDVGDTEIYYYTDRADINPSLVPKVAIAYRNKLLSWVDGETTFEPKKEITASDAAEFLYRFAHPEKATYLYMEDDYFNNYGTTVEKLYKDINTTDIRKRTKQWGFEAAGESCIDVSKQSGVSEGTDGVTIDSGNLVRKVTRNAYDMTTIVTFNELDFVPGKKYVMEFSAKLPDEFSSSYGCNMESYTTFGVTDGTGTISTTKIKSGDWQDFSMVIDIPADTELTEANNSVHIRLTNSGYNGYYFDNTVYTVLLKDIVFTEETAITISSSSIADGEENVMTPIDSVYIYTSSAVDTSMVTSDKFTITGTDATIRDAEAIDANTIRVGIDGCSEDEAYTLSVSGIKNAAGGVLNDSISWTTAAAGGEAAKLYTLDFEGTESEAMPSGYIKWNHVSGRTDDSYEISGEKAYTGSQSLKLTTADLALGYATFTLYGMTPKTPYRISFYYSSEYWKNDLNTGSSGGTYGTPVVTDTTKEGWKRCSIDFTPDSTYATLVLYNFIHDNSGVDNIYIDDLTVRKIVETEEKTVKVCRPNIFKNGIPVSELGTGSANIEIKVKTTEGEKGIWGVLAQYDSDGKLISTTPAEDTATTEKDAVLKINLSDAKDLETKIFVMDSTTYEPYSKAICMDK